MNALRAFLLLLMIAADAIAAPEVYAQPANAAAFIEQLGASTIEQLTGPGIAQDERKSRFRALLNDNFDMPAIAKFTLGRYWRSATEAQRSEFVQLFEDFIVQSYAVRFGDYSGDNFKVLGAANDQDGVTVVRSKIERGGAEPIRLDWRLKPRGDSYVIIDIIAEGVSMAVTQRSEFASVIQSKGGLDGLLEALREKTSGGDQNASQ